MVVVYSLILGVLFSEIAFMVVSGAIVLITFSISLLVFSAIFRAVFIPPSFVGNGLLVLYSMLIFPLSSVFDFL